MLRFLKRYTFSNDYFHESGGAIGESPLHIAARIEESRGEKCTKMLLKSGADTNLALSDGKTPLHISAESGTIAVLRHLLANGADPWKQDKVKLRIQVKFILIKRLFIHNQIHCILY